MQHELKISFRDVMASAFRRHARGEAFRALTRQMENPQKAVRRWQMPWMYLRLFGILLLMAAVCLACIWLDIGALPAPYLRLLLVRIAFSADVGNVPLGA